jgi:hypothetical protein
MLLPSELRIFWAEGRRILVLPGIMSNIISNK